MLQAHSFLWHYGWVAPSLLTLGLAACGFFRGLHRRFPAYFAYLIFVSIEQLTLYFLDISPASPITWWRAFWAGTILEALLKFSVVAELLHSLLNPWPSVAKVVRNIVSSAGVFFVLLAGLTAAFAAPDNTAWLVSGGHVLSQTFYLTQAGLIISIFAVAAILRIPWERRAFGISLGFAVVWCGHLAIWALVSGGVVRNRGWEDLANMATYHLGVLIWYYYLLVSKKSTSTKPKDKDKHRQHPPTDPPSSSHGSSEENQQETLEDWNRELERLIHQ
jgi:hypothetical protein